MNLINYVEPIIRNNLPYTSDIIHLFDGIQPKRRKTIQLSILIHTPTVLPIVVGLDLQLHYGERLTKKDIDVQIQLIKNIFKVHLPEMEVDVVSRTQWANAIETKRETQTIKFTKALEEGLCLTDIRCSSITIGERDIINIIRSGLYSNEDPTSPKARYWFIKDDPISKTHTAMEVVIHTDFWIKLGFINDLDIDHKFRPKLEQAILELLQKDMGDKQVSVTTLNDFIWDQLKTSKRLLGTEKPLTEQLTNMKPLMDQLSAIVSERPDLIRELEKIIQNQRAEQQLSAIVKGC